MKKFVEKFFRLTKEALFVLVEFKNPIVYYRERLRRSRGANVILRLRNGARYSLHANTNEIRMINEIWNMNVYDPLMKYIHDGSTVVDIGANVGIFSVKAGRRAHNIRVFSYEPFPESFAALKENIRLNGLEGSVVPTNAAVAGRKGELELFFRPHDPGGVSLYKYGDTSELSSIKVPAITLVDIFREHAIDYCDYLKMDCEGAEEQIVLETPKELFSRIKSITMEWHYDLNKLSTEEFRRHLEMLGYKTDYTPATFTLYAWRA